MTAKEMEARVREVMRETSYDFTSKPMFGGVFGWVNSKPFASFSNVGLGIKLSPNDQTVLLAIPGAKRLQYEPTDPPSKSYILLPDSIIADDDQLLDWLKRSSNFALQSSAKKPKGKNSPETGIGTDNGER